MYKVIKEDYIVDLLEQITYVKFLRGTTKRTITDITNADGFVGSDKKTVYVLQGKLPPAGYEEKVVQLIQIGKDEYLQLKELRETTKSILVNPNSLTDIRSKKIDELSESCKNEIIKGISVKLSDNFYHQFALTVEDQINLEGLVRQADKGARYLLYHESGCISRLYNAADIRKVHQAAFEHKQKHQLYFNCLKYCINNLYDKDIIDSITYGDDILSLPLSHKIKHQVEVILND